MRNNIHKFRVLKGVYQEQLANELGVTRSYLSKLECNRLEARKELMIKICKYFIVSLGQMFYIVEDNKKTNIPWTPCPNLQGGYKMFIKFTEVGRDKKTWIEECRNELTYLWFYNRVKKVLMSDTIDFTDDGKIIVGAGLAVGEFEIMRKPDAVYQDMLKRDIDLLINLDDEECHKVVTVDDERVDIYIWNKAMREDSQKGDPANE